MIRTIVGLVLAALGLYGQSTGAAQVPAAPSTQPYTPSAFVDVGVTWDKIARTYTDSVAFAQRLGNQAIYSYTAVDVMQGKTSTRTGLASIMARSGRWALVSVATAGVTSSQASTTPAYSFEGFVMYDIGRNGAHWYLMLGGAERLEANGVRYPVLMFRLGRGM